MTLKRWAHIEIPTLLNVIKPNQNTNFVGNNSPRLPVRTYSASGWGVELTKSFFNKGSYAIRSVLTRHPPCSVVWTAGQVICLILRTMNSLDFSADENWVCIHHITWFAGKHLPPSSACLKYGPMPLWPWWKSIVCLWQVFSDMICVNTYVIVSVMHV